MDARWRFTKVILTMQPIESGRVGTEAVASCEGMTSPQLVVDSQQPRKAFEVVHGNAKGPLRRVRG